MKIIKKLCIPLLSLVLVLGCFAVSQMDASAYNSPYVCSAHRVYENMTSCTVQVAVQDSSGPVTFIHEHVYRCPVAGCNGSNKDTLYSGLGQSCMQSTAPSHTHNYSTAWGAWRKISSCRLLG